MVLEKLDLHMQKKKILDTVLTLFRKVKSAKITNLNAKCKTVKFWDHIGEMLGDLGFDNDFLDTTLKAWFMIEITDGLDFISI